MGGGGGRSTPYNSLYGEASPEKGIFFRPRVYERVGISLYEVHERVGNVPFRSVKMSQKGLQKALVAVKESRKFSCFVIDSYFK